MAKCYRQELTHLITNGPTGYELILFHAFDAKGIAIYHTNVALSIGTSVAVLCAESITNEKEKCTPSVLSNLHR